MFSSNSLIIRKNIICKAICLIESFKILSRTIFLHLEKQIFIKNNFAKSRKLGPLLSNSLEKYSNTKIKIIWKDFNFLT